MANKTFDFPQLPSKLRLAIYDYVRPAEWCYKYKVGTLTGPVKGTSTPCNLPALFAASKWTHNEAMNPVSRHSGVCKIHMGSNIHTNFPLVNLLDEPQRTDLVRDKEVRLPACQTLILTIWAPSQKTAEDFIQTRRSVAKVVNWLNACDYETPPSIQIKLGMTATARGVKCKYEDFAMLITPLARLQKLYTSVVVSRGPGYTKLDFKIERQCGLLQHILNNGSEAALKELTYQQAILDVRLQMWYIKSNLPDPSDKASRGDSLPYRISKSSMADLRAATQKLQVWCKIQDAYVPIWLTELLGMIENQGVSKRETKYMFDRVIRPESARLERWAAGQYPTFDPLSLL